MKRLVHGKILSVPSGSCSCLSFGDGLRKALTSELIGRLCLALSRVHADLGRYIHVAYTPLLQFPGFLHDCAWEAHCTCQHVAKHAPFNRVGIAQLLAPEDEDGWKHRAEHEIQKEGWRAVETAERDTLLAPCDTSVLRASRLRSLAIAS